MRIRAEHVQKRPAADWCKPTPMKSLRALRDADRVAWLSMTSTKTHTVELLHEDRLETHCATLMKNKLMHEMEVSFLEIWW